VIDEETSEAELISLNNAGVRGVRVNLETSGQHDPEFVRHALQWAAQKVKSLNWHIQIYTTLEVIEAVSDCLLTLPVPVVVDHFGRITASQGADQSGFQNLLKLVASGRIWVKLSAAHRISDHPDCADVRFFVEALVRAHPDRMLWGSDWPHLRMGDDTPDPKALLDLFRSWISDEDIECKILADTPKKLFGFTPVGT
jgi:predicted TIM-barrel fold metal-dependent hydrolase